MSEKEGDFKIKDKRRFTHDGEPRDGVEIGTEPSSDFSEDTPENKNKNEGESLFEGIIASFYTSALFALGEIETKDRNKEQIDLKSASSMIDLLTMLEIKTKGNLTEREKGVLDSAIYQLRMVYVKKAH